MFKKNHENSNGKEKTKMTKKKLFGIIGAVVGTIAGVCIGAAVKSKKDESVEVEGEFVENECEALEAAEESDEVVED